jgi:hypothetical protein
VQDTRAPAAAPSPLDPPEYHPGIGITTITVGARFSTGLAIIGWTVIVALSMVEQRGLISFNPNHHSALMSFASVNLINTAVLWAAVALAGRQDRLRKLTEERFDAMAAAVRQAVDDARWKGYAEALEDGARPPLSAVRHD